jgi:hypothetical protein
MIEPAVQGTGTSFPLLYAALSLVGGWVGGFVGTYFNKKGENLATKQDIAEITQTTKDIEAKISSEYWVRQRNFDMKREAAFELLRQAASFQESVVGLLSFGWPESAQKRNGNVLAGEICGRFAFTREGYFSS